MQHDMVLDNAPGLTFRADSNGALAALVSNSSGASAPATMYAYMFWADTSSGLLKQRNAANSAWITIGTLADTNLGLLSLAGGTMTGAVNSKGFNVAAHATTCDIWSAGNFGNLTGSVVTFTDVADAPIADAWRWIRSNAAHILTSNANITVQGGTRTVAAGDIMLWHAITTSTFEVFVIPISGTVVDASDTQKGVIEIATDAEITTGSDTVRAVSPGRMKSHKGVTKAWVNFNGTGTLSVRSQYNVSSVSDDGTGLYTINFATAMPDANYSFSGTAAGTSGSDPALWVRASVAYSTTAVAISTGSSAVGSFSDATHVSATINGN